MNTIIIDTANNKEVKVGIEINGKEYSMIRKIDKNKTQAVLPLIDKLIKSKKLKIIDINKIKVNVSETGSFMGIKIGLSVANALSFALKIPVEKIQFD